MEGASIRRRTLVQGEEGMKDRVSHVARLAMVVAAVLAIPVLLQAHAKLQRSDPASGATLTAAPAHIQLWFDEEVDVKLSRIAMTGPAGKVALGPTQAMGEKSLMATVPGSLADATYSVSWQAVASDDGHLTKGTFKFTVKRSH
jgi:methionine-rich copper-binding protein CopC